MGLLCILGVCWGFLLYLGFHVGFGCCGYVVSYGFFMWASWVAPVYTSCVLRGALRFFNEIFLLIKKKKKTLHLSKS
jgi:hypothetical protein